MMLCAIHWALKELGCMLVCEATKPGGGWALVCMEIGGPATATINRHYFKRSREMH